MRIFDSKDDLEAKKEEVEEKPPVRDIEKQAALVSDEFNAQGDVGITPVKYTKEVFGRWQIDHGRRVNDYMIHLIPRRPIHADPRAIIEAIIRRLTPIVPDDVQVYIQPPSKRVDTSIDIDFYTVRLADIMRRPGAEAIVTKRIPLELSEIDAWSD